MSLVDKQQANNLWQSIQLYAIAASELGSEGNSGEFHSSKNEKALMKELDQKLKTLITDFVAATGWTPVLIKGTKSNGYEYYWTLEPRQSNLA